jgi:serine/threonine protein kinase
MDLRQPIAAVLQGLSSVSHGSNIEHVFSRVSVEHLHVKYDGRVYWRAGGGGGGKGKGESYGGNASPTKTEGAIFYPPEYLLREAELNGGKSDIAMEAVAPWSWSQAAVFALGMLTLHLKSGTSVIGKGGNSIRTFINYISLLGFPPPFMIKALNAVRLGPEERRGLEDIIKERNSMPKNGRCAKIMAGLSWNAQDFILKCLQWDPAKRITISEALKHRYCITTF